MALGGQKLGGYDFYNKILGAPKYIVAPMVDQSELAWRMLCRKYGAQLCYTPMFHSSLFAKDPKYRKEALQTCPDDRPLIVQFCGNDAKVILEAALLAQNHCDAVDINLGCPQAIARRGHYGSFLQDEWDLLKDIVSTLHRELSVPVTCKVRIFEDRKKTIEYAKMLEEAGCQMLTVHGRTREQKGPLTGIADWSYIREVRQNIKIPMFANGNILGLEDIERCLEATGVDGVMTAEGNLHNPALFTEILATTWQMADEYLNYVELYPCPTSYIRGHLFKIFHHILNIKSNFSLREEMAVANQVDRFRNVSAQIKAKYLPFHEGQKIYVAEDDDTSVAEESYNLCLPPWICQPYIRIPPETHKLIIAEKVRLAEDPNTVKRQYFDNDGNEISRKRMKKLRRRSRRPDKNEMQSASRNLKPCLECIANPMGSKCLYSLCRVCCRNECFKENKDCSGHGIYIKSRRAKAKFKEENNIDTDRRINDMYGLTANSNSQKLNKMIIYENYLTLKLRLGDKELG